MTITNGYATLAEYKSFFSVRGLSGITGDDASDDSIIEILIEATSRFIDRETGRKFYEDSADTTYYYQARSDSFIELPDFSSITTVSVDYNETRTYTDLVANTDYDLLPDNYLAEGLPIRGIALSPLSTTYFPTQRRGIKVVGKRGWSQVPADIKDATLAIVQNIYGNRTGQSNNGNISVTAAGVVIRPRDVPDWCYRIIHHYRGFV